MIGFIKRWVDKMFLRENRRPLVSDPTNHVELEARLSDAVAAHKRTTFFAGIKSIESISNTEDIRSAVRGVLNGMESERYANKDRD